MALTRSKYLVYLNPTEENPDPPEDGVEVEVTHGDRLRGELEAGKQGLPAVNVAPMNHSTVWLWCAMVRLGLYRADFRQFKLVDLAGLEPVKDENGEPAVEDVDPTTAGQSGPA